jgi:HMG (high mobility group) box
VVVLLIQFHCVHVTTARRCCFTLIVSKKYSSRLDALESHCCYRCPLLLLPHYATHMHTFTLHADLDAKDVMRRLGELWKELSAKEQEKYKTQAHKAWVAAGGPAAKKEHDAAKAIEKEEKKEAKVCY